MKANNQATVDEEEIARFTRIADEWWDPQGKFKPLHAINALRVEWIAQQTGPLTDKRLLDVGCGGGLVSEAMAKLGARVTGIDAGEKNIAVAQAHAAQSGLDIDYRCMAAENLQEQFDIVLALEIVEHVADIDAFIAAISNLVKPGGLLVMSTLNRTAKSFAFAIVGAEYVLRWLPRGTHQWQKFLKPSELCSHLRKNNIEVTEMMGLTLDPLSFTWKLNPRDLGVNYLVAGTKRG